MPHVKKTSVGSPEKRNDHVLVAAAIPVIRNNAVCTTDILADVQFSRRWELGLECFSISRSNCQEPSEYPFRRRGSHILAMRI